MSTALGLLLGYGAKAAKVVEIAGAAVVVGEAVHKHAPRVLDTAGSVVLALLGAPATPDPQALPQIQAAPVALLPAIGDAGPSRRTVCPTCQPSITIAGGAETIDLAPCEECNTSALAIAGHVGALYDGWAESYGVPVLGDACGTKPNQNDPKYVAHLGNYQPMLYFRDLATWQECTMANAAKAVADKAAAALRAAEIAAAEKRGYRRAVNPGKAATAASWALAAQKKQYDDQLAALNALPAGGSQQSQIDALIAQKANLDRLAAVLAAPTPDLASQQQQLNLQAELALAAQRPGGIASLLSMATQQQQNPIDQLQQLQQLQAQQQLQANQLTQANQQSQLQQLQQLQQMAQSQQQDALPWGGAPEQGYSDEQFYADYGIEGAGDDAPIDPELAETLGIAGAATNGDARMVFGIRNAGWGEDDLAALNSMLSSGAAEVNGCDVGRCGIPGASL